MAAGFTIEENKIDEFREFIIKKYKKIKQNIKKQDKLMYDSKISPSALNENFFNQVNITFSIWIW